MSHLRLLIVLLCCTFCLQAQPRPPQRYQSIRQVDFRNFDYYVGSGVCSEMMGKTTVPVRNGSYVPNRNEPDIAFGVYPTITYGDITGDGYEEAVIITSCGGMHPAEQAHIYTLENSHPVLLTDLEEGDRANGGILSALVCVGCTHGITIRNRLLTVQRMWGKAACCPEYIEKNTYRWNGSRLLQIGAPQRRKFIPRT